MKRKLLVILFSILAMVTAVFGLTACGGSDNCEHNFTVVKEAKKATCSEAGTRQVQKCSDCGIYYIPATSKEFKSEDDAFNAAALSGGSHDLEYVKDSEPTSCKVPGYREHYKCKDCNKVFSDSSGKTQINLNDVMIEGEHDLAYFPYAEPGCDTEGNYTYYKCDDCGIIFSDSGANQEITLESVIIAPAGHNFEYGHHERVESTCMYGGSIEYYSCSRCQKWYTDETAENEITNHDDIWLNILEHDYSVRTTLREADCEIEEIVKISCKNGCDYYEEITVENSALEHEFVGGKCTNCECDEFSLGLEIDRVYGFSDYVVIGFGSWQTEDVLIIPNTYKGEKVEAVYIENTSALNGVKKIILPENVKWVRFSGETSNTTVTEVVIKSSEMNFGGGAFYSFNALTTITVPDEFTVKGVGYSAFYETAIDKFTFDGEYDAIGNAAFYGCTNLTEIYIPSSVTEIRTNAFYECTSLEKVIIDDVKNWLKIYMYPDAEANPLYYAHHLYKKTNDGVEPYGDIVLDENIIDAEYLQNYNDIGQNLFRGCYDIVKVVLPNGIEEVEDYAFKGCINLVEVELCPKTSIGGGTFAKIAQEAFMDCSSLEAITIPSSLTKIYYQAFFGCDNLTNVYFAGDENTWRNTWLNVTFSETTSNPMYTGNATLYFYNGSEYYSTTQSGVNLKSQIVDGKRQSFEIKDYAFVGFSVKIHGIDYANKIGNYAFYNAKGVQGYLELDGVAGMSNVDYPDNFQGVTYVGECAFKNCENLETVKFGNHLEEVADGAFENSGIKELIMLGKNTEVGFAILNNCKQVESLQLAFLGDTLNGTYLGNRRLSYYFTSNANSIPTTLEMISVEDGQYYDYSLEGARGLKYIYLPESFYMSGRALGYNARPLDSLTIYYEGSLEAWIDNGGLGEDKLSQAITLYVYEGGQYDLVDDLVIPASITNGVRDSIGSYTFTNVVSITKVTIHNSFKFDTSSKNTFKGCVNLKEVYNYTSTELTAGQDSYYYIAKYATDVFNGLS